MKFSDEKLKTLGIFITDVRKFLEFGIATEAKKLFENFNAKLLFKINDTKIKAKFKR